MGGDGGSIPTRCELVKAKKKDPKRDRNAERVNRWQTCQLTQVKLQFPIVACAYGRLYNKEAVVELLLRRKRETSMDPSTDPMPHVKSLRDFRELKLTPRKDSTASKCTESGAKVSHGASIADMTAQFVCPISGLEMNGIYPFVFLWRCGCVLSKRALFELASEGTSRPKETDESSRSLPSTCPNCNAPLNETDVVVINAEGDDLELMKQRWEARKEAAKPKTSTTNASSSSTSTCTSTISTASATSQAHGVGVKRAHVESGSKEVPERAAKAARASGASAVAGGVLDNVNMRALLAPGGVQRDPRSTSAFKSLFTTSDSAKRQDDPKYFNDFFFR